MSLIFSAIVPHPPILIPTIGKNNLAKIKQTVLSYEKISTDLEKTKPDSLIIISPHGLVQANSFTINASEEFICQFEEFGDLSSRKKIPGSFSLASRIKERLESSSNVQMISEKILDYGSAVPAWRLLEKLPKTKLLPIYYSGLNLREHFKFGQLLKKQFIFSQEKIAVVASGDLSHRLTKNAPAGYFAKAKNFDKKIVELLKKDNLEEFLNTDEAFAREAAECGLKSIAILLGIVDGLKKKPTLLSYEAPFGVGYMALDYRL